MKLSVSLPEEEVEFLDEFADSQGIESRSAVLLRAVRLLKASQLSDAYTAAWAEWDESEDAELWEATASDGLGQV